MYPQKVSYKKSKNITESTSTKLPINIVCKCSFESYYY